MRPRIAALIPLILCVWLSACSNSVWQKPGSGAKDFATDLAACEAKEEAQERAYAGARGTNTSNLQYVKYQCLAKLGWAPAKN
jgi:hypothetical protein